MHSQRGSMSGVVGGTAGGPLGLASQPLQALRGPWRAGPVPVAGC